jgi:hypothetical protein
MSIERHRRAGRQAERAGVSESIKPTGMRRDRRASPKGREVPEEFESMQEKRKEFAEQGAELYAKP